MTSTCVFLLSACDSLCLLWFQKKTVTQLLLNITPTQLSLLQHFCWRNSVHFSGHWRNEPLSGLSWCCSWEAGDFPWPPDKTACQEGGRYRWAWHACQGSRSHRQPSAHTLLAAPCLAPVWACSADTQLVNMQLPANKPLPVRICVLRALGKMVARGRGSPGFLRPAVSDHSHPITSWLLRDNPRAAKMGSQRDF